MVPAWTVYGYRYRGVSVIDDWLKMASDAAAAKLDSRLLILSQLAQWKHEYAHKLKGECEGLFELLLEADGVAHRPLCCYAPGRMKFTILLFAVEHNNRLRPPEACATALGRCDEVRQDHTRAIEYDGYKS